MSGGHKRALTDIGFLHTAQVHRATFEALARQQNLNVSHQVEADWLAEAIRFGFNDGLRLRVQNALTSLAENAFVVICTCSTLGELTTRLNNPRVFRVDQPMMDLAAARPEPVYLAYCLQSTRLSSSTLLQRAFHKSGRTESFQMIDCGRSWPLFVKGETAAFGESIAQQVAAAVATKNNTKNGATVVLAQASMAAAQTYLQPVAGLKSYASPASAMDHAVRLLS